MKNKMTLKDKLDRYTHYLDEMSEDKLISLEEHNKAQTKLKEEKKEEEMAYRTRLTNIKCEKCDGIYRYIDSFEVFVTNKKQTGVICNKCNDTQCIEC